MKWDHFRGGSQIVLEISQKEGSDGDEKMIRRVAEILDQRLEELEVRRRIVNVQSENRIVIQLPREIDANRLADMMGAEAVLEFKLVPSDEFITQVVTQIDARLEEVFADSAGIERGVETSVTAVEDTLEDLMDALLFPFGEERPPPTEKPFSNLLSVIGSTSGSDIVVAINYVKYVESYLEMERVQEVIPKSHAFFWGVSSIIGDDREYRHLYLLPVAAEMTGQYIEEARVTVGGGSSEESRSRLVVGIEFTREGARLFERITGAHIGERLAMVLDGIVRTAPVIRSRIPGGRAQIEGFDSWEECRDVMVYLKAGRLPCSVEVIEIRELTEAMWLGDESDSGK